MILFFVTYKNCLKNYFKYFFIYFLLEIKHGLGIFFELILDLRLIEIFYCGLETLRG